MVKVKITYKRNKDVSKIIGYLLFAHILKLTGIPVYKIIFVYFYYLFAFINRNKILKLKKKLQYI